MSRAIACPSFGPFVVAGFAHAVADLVGQVHAGDLVVQELGVAGVGERQHADDDRLLELRRAVEERLELLLLEDVLRDEEVRARLDLAAHQAQLRLQRVGVQVRGAADDERRLPPDRLAGEVDAVVQQLEEADEADRADVPDADDVRVAADGGRVAAQAEDVADAEDVRADHVAVNRHRVAVAGGVVHDDLDADLALEQHGHRERRHADLRRRAVADVDDVDAGVLEELRALDRLARAEPVRRVHLHGDDEAPGLELLGEGEGLGGGFGAPPSSAPRRQGRRRAWRGLWWGCRAWLALRVAEGGRGGKECRRPFGVSIYAGWATSDCVLTHRTQITGARHIYPEESAAVCFYSGPVGGGSPVGQSDSNLVSRSPTCCPLRCPRRWPTRRQPWKAK